MEYMFLCYTFKNERMESKDSQSIKFIFDKKESIMSIKFSESPSARNPLSPQLETCIHHFKTIKYRRDSGFLKTECV